MTRRPPQVVVLGGPNGAGKTTAARGILRDLLDVGEFVNADTIAAGLAGFAPERSAFAAGRIMLARLHELAAARKDFSFESTLASRSFYPWLDGMRSSGYQVNIVFMWLRSPELAIRRVRSRVLEGGHSVPNDVVRRRYSRGISNFLTLYASIADRWRVYDNSSTSGPRLVAHGGCRVETQIALPSTWKQVVRETANGEQKSNDI